MFQRLKNILIGEPLTHDDSGDGHLLSKIQALAMLSSDALSSIAYGPEQVVLVLTAVSSATIGGQSLIGLWFSSFWPVLPFLIDRLSKPILKVVAPIW